MKFILPEEAAQLLQVDEAAIIDLLEQKKLPGVKLGSVWRIEEGRLQDFLNAALDGFPERYEDYAEEYSLPPKRRKGRRPSGKYDGLKKFLQQAKGDKLQLAFTDIERVMNDKLPQSAYRLRPWWANDSSHSQARAWFHAGWETHGVDLENRLITFVRRGSEK